MSSIMGQIQLEHAELFALEFGKIAESDCLHPSIYKYSPISTKLFDYKISNEFDYGFNRTRTELHVFALEFAEIAESDLVYTLASTNVDQLVPNMVTIRTTIISCMSLIIGQIWQ